jgi:NAD+ synthase (glutamine-hydrolysing)
MILSALAGNEKAFFTCNGNKIETAIGYATLNGDMRGAICPIADLTKEDIYNLATYLNNVIFKKKIIPENMIPNKDFQFIGENKIQPSAELKDNQVDPIKIGYHCKLIEQIMDYKKISANQICQWWIYGILHTKLNISEELMKIYNVNNSEEFLNDLKWVIGKIRTSVFKRVQSPPIIVLTKTAFGFDLRESILPEVTNFIDRELEDKILKMKTYNSASK